MWDAKITFALKDRDGICFKIRDETICTETRDEILESISDCEDMYTEFLSSLITRREYGHDKED